MDTLFINLFAGPSAGKSTVAAGIYFQLKSKYKNVEYISEYAKDLVWADRSKDLTCQPYIAAKQFYKQFRVMGKVELAVVDSPILLALAYPGFGSTPAWETSIAEQFNLFKNVNYVLTRRKDIEFQTEGRIHNYTESVGRDQLIINIMQKYNVPYTVLDYPNHTETVQFICDELK